MAGIPKREIHARVDQAADILSITELLDRKPRQLSGGQRQRVAMNRALVREPAAFLMDEPLSNLDAQLRLELRTEITTIHRRIGAPTLYVTHDQIEATSMADRIASSATEPSSRSVPPSNCTNSPPTCSSPDLSARQQ